MSRSRSVDDFERDRAHLTTFVKQDILPLMEDEEIHRILIRAPVKSGKREIVEYIAKRDESRDPHRVHAFLSAWHRVSDEEQRQELANHNMKVFSITSAKNKEECVKWIRAKLDQGKRIVLHLDECDFGTGSRQQLGTMYHEFRNHPMILFLLYSATPQEILFSGEVDAKEDESFNAMVDDMIYFGKHVAYTPPEGYCGPGRFLEEGLVFDAKPFFSCNDGFRLSPQATNILNQLKESIKEHPERNVIVLRLSSSDLYGQGERKEKKQIYQFLKGAGTCPELQEVDIIVDKSEKDVNGLRGISLEKIQWSNPKYWRRLSTGMPIIFVIDQTASRSTEFACHHRMFAYHDFRHVAVYTTVSQAQERVNHYEQKYGGFQRIQIYGHKKTFECSAGLIDYAQYMTLPWKKQKIDKRRSPEERYEIKSTSDGSLHPVHRIPLTSIQADETLHDLSSYTEVKISARVRGRIASVPIIKCKFMACEPDQFGEKVGELKQKFGRSFKNPFVASSKEGLEQGKWKGYIRQWKVFQYEELKPQIWGMEGTEVRLTICYQGDLLGLAVRSNTHQRRKVDSLETFNSMYQA